MTDRLLVSLPQACIWTNLARLGLPAACVIERSIEILVMIFEVSYSCMEAALTRARILVLCFGAESLNLMVVACPRARGKLVSQTNLCYSHQNDFGLCQDARLLASLEIFCRGQRNTAQSESKRAKHLDKITGAQDAPLSGLGSAKNGAKEAVFNAGAVITNKASEIKTGLGAGTQMIGTALGSSSATQPAEGLFKRDQENAQNASRFNPRKQLGSYSV
ncbi:hypothetical protein OOU_Y34scaffold00719g46 [Pyricularia oryzae Y34]|uniref:Uncharacterized protein n=2 Tax=Pyricularia oryzae TaxID=318829 RepID=A0AA97PHZ8_PYRO3|nr:hypothetical protein OOU_Y34scaffold00719g46 [Pyricularia oryzae Y34]